jgi:hypothetical protein
MSRARLVGFGLIVVAVMSIARVAGAQTFGPDRAEPLTLDFAPALLNASAVPMARPTGLEHVPQRPKLGGKSLLNSLYASTVAMQVLDVHSTLRAFNAGAVEGNPAMAGITGNRAAFVATKAAVAAASIWAAHKLSKRNKVAAVVTLVAVNSAYAMIVSHNYRLAGRLGS